MTGGGHARLNNILGTLDIPGMMVQTDVLSNRALFRGANENQAARGNERGCR